MKRTAATSEMSPLEITTRLRWGVNLSTAALVIVEKLGTGKSILLYHPTDQCLLIERNDHWEILPDAKRAYVDREAVDELRATGVVSPLSQHGYFHKVGWRSFAGNLGEHYDVYLCTQ